MEDPAILLDEVKLAIEKALPALHVDVLKRCIDEAERIKKEYAILKNQHETLTISNSKLEQEIGQLKMLKFAADKISSDRSQLEFDKKVFEVDKKLKDVEVYSAKEKVDLVKDL